MRPSVSNHVARFWLGVVVAADFIDDPEGFRHPLCDRAAALGVSPAQLYNFCRHVQKVWAKDSLQSAENGGEGEGLGFEGVNSASEDFDFGHLKPLCQTWRAINDTVNWDDEGVERRPTEDAR